MLSFLSVDRQRKIVGAFIENALPIDWNALPRDNDYDTASTPPIRPAGEFVLLGSNCLFKWG
jgi:hypothetical protein